MEELRNQKVQAGGVCMLKDEDRFIYYLITKQSTYGKPTYQTLESSLNSMKIHMVNKTLSVNF